MCEKIGENETLSLKSNSLNNKIASNESTPTVLSFCQSYEKRMVDYMQSVPHIPPTQFELRLRHNDIKVDVIKQFKNSPANSNKANSKQLISKLDNLIEKVFTNLAKKNIKEYKTCQAGFIIGWKCNVNKPQPKTQTTDDRF